ncbi:hypothetical protein GCM10011408_00850 [Dyella caseinilytica]|nr:hypothetical protein GCM10011408_00850 [Dyella caseinilytica]
MATAYAVVLYIIPPTEHSKTQTSNALISTKCLAGKGGILSLHHHTIGMIGSKGGMDLTITHVRPRESKHG